VTYELAEGPLPRPELPGTVIVARSKPEVLDAIGLDLLGYAQACVRAFGDFHLALSGGSTPMPLYERLMYDPEFRAFPWRRTHLWIVDERCVPFDDERSNFGKIREVIVAHSDIPREQVHPIEATRPDADAAYEAELKETLGWREKGQDRLDVVLLGMGADGHTASLFPNTTSLDERSRLVAFCRGPKVSPDRVTLTYRALNGARVLMPLVCGKDKAEMLARVARREGSVRDVPILGLSPVAGEMRWYLDADAASGERRPAADA